MGVGCKRVLWSCVCAAWAVSVECGSPWETELLRGVKFRHSDALALGRDAESQALQDLKGIRHARPSTSFAGAACAACSEKDYSDLCPSHWVEVGDDGRCEAPPSYSGFCNDTLSFVGLSGDAKQEVEVACSVCWPCNESCARNYALPCPNGYASKTMNAIEYGDASGDACVAISETECEYEISFRDAAEKASFARRCSTSWPCESTCEFASGCPIDWTAIGEGMCVAPSSYKREGCSLLLEGVFEWPRSKKVEFAKQCGVRWQCASGESVGEADGISMPGAIPAHGGGRSPNRVVVVDGPL